MKYVYIALGIISFGLGAIGAVLPILPTVPFLLLSSFCFTKGSERFSNWLKSTKLYQKHLDSYVENRSMPLKTKISILAFASTSLLLAFWMMDNMYGRVAVLCVMVFKYYYFIFKIETGV